MSFLSELQALKQVVIPEVPTGQMGNHMQMLIKCMVAYIFCCEAWSNYENLQKRFSVDTPKSW